MDVRRLHVHIDTSSNIHEYSWKISWNAIFFGERGYELRVLKWKKCIYDIFSTF